ncbi:MAG: sodium:calcium antiporter [Clostridia bacterium]|nr:sodium:calcium antiporter [Clostridia bacterium]
MLTAIYLVGGLILILAAAEFFTNGVEWLGKKLNLSEGAVGSVLAAVGTALPESLIPVIAILFGSSEASHEIGIGAILGAPFMLATLAMAVTGIAALICHINGRKRSHMLINPEIAHRDLRYFLVVYALAILASFLPWHWLKVVVALALVAAYIIYAYLTIKSGKSLEDSELNPLYFAKKQADPALKLVVLQVIAALAAIIIGAKIFVIGLEDLASYLGISAFILAVFITPIATELPEKFNSVIWIRQGKDTLALGNITGAMVFQSSILPAIGILLTPWTLEGYALINAILALAAAGTLCMVLRFKKMVKPALLTSMGLLYLLYILIVVIS